MLHGLEKEGEEEEMEDLEKCLGVSTALLLLPPKYYGIVLGQDLKMASVSEA